MLNWGEIVNLDFIFFLCFRLSLICGMASINYFLGGRKMKTIFKNFFYWLCLQGKIGRGILKIRNTLVGKIGINKIQRYMSCMDLFAELIKNRKIIWEILEFLVELFW